MLTLLVFGLPTAYFVQNLEGCSLSYKHITHAKLGVIKYQYFNCLSNPWLHMHYVVGLALNDAQSSENQMILLTLHMQKTSYIKAVEEFTTPQNNWVFMIFQILLAS